MDNVHPRHDPYWTKSDPGLNESWRNMLRKTLQPFQEWGKRQVRFAHENRELLVPMAVSVFELSVYQSTLVTANRENVYQVYPEMMESLYFHLTSKVLRADEVKENRSIYHDLLESIGVPKASSGRMWANKTLIVNSIKLLQSRVDTVALSVHDTEMLSLAVERAMEVWDRGYGKGDGASTDTYDPDEISHLFGAAKFEDSQGQYLHGIEALAAEMNFEIEQRRLEAAERAKRDKDEAEKKKAEAEKLADLEREELEVRERLKDIEDRKVKAELARQQAEVQRLRQEAEKTRNAEEVEKARLRAEALTEKLRADAEIERLRREAEAAETERLRLEGVEMERLRLEEEAKAKQPQQPPKERDNVTTIHPGGGMKTVTQRPANTDEQERQRAALHPPSGGDTTVDLWAAVFLPEVIQAARGEFTEPDFEIRLSRLLGKI